jgi:hypothetical protein
MTYAAHVLQTCLLQENYSTPQSFRNPNTDEYCVNLMEK